MCLRERFCNKQEVVYLHYSQIITMQVANKNTYSLRLFQDRIQRHLEVLKQDINQDVFVSMVQAKLPEEILLQPEIMNGPDNERNTAKLSNTLRSYVKAREKSEAKQESTEHSAKGSVVKHRLNFGHEQNHSQSKQTLNSVSKQKCDQRASPSVSSAEAPVIGEKLFRISNYSEICRYCSKRHWRD